MQRSPQQNKAMHLLFEMIAIELNDAGLDMRKTLKPEIEIPWTKDTVKEYLWRPVQKTQFMKKSTTELDDKEVGEVFETLNRWLAQRHGVSFEFPSIEQVIESLKDKSYG